MENSLKVENEILNRIKQVTGKVSDKELAELLGIKQGNFSARKQRGSLLPLITEWAIQTDYDLNWLLKGKGEMKSTSNVFLKDVENWIEELIELEPYRKDWFRAELEDKFPAFKKWKEEKKGKAEVETDYPIYKVA